MDIRDLVIEDDLFDPLSEEEDGDAQVAVQEPEDEEEQPLIGEPMEEREEPEEDTRPPRQRIYDLLSQMPGQKRLLLSIIGYCRDEKTGPEMDAYTRELQEDTYSVYAPVILRELLEQAGAIEYLVYDDPADEGESETAQADDVALESDEDAATCASQDADAQDSEGDVQTVDMSDQVGHGERLVAASVASLSVADGSTPDDAVLIDDELASMVRHEVWDSDLGQIDIEFLEIEAQLPGVWRATPDGIQVVDEQDDFAAIRRLLRKEPQYESVYQRILDFCKDEGRGAKELDRLVNDDPLLEEPRRYSGYFIGRLEREGALKWSNGWVLTKDGARVLQLLVDGASEMAMA